MTAASGDPGETPPSEQEYPVYPAYEFPAGPGYETVPGTPPGYPVAHPPPPAYPPPPYPPPPPYGTPYPAGYGYPGYPGYAGYPPPRPAGTNPLAIASLVCAVLGIVPFCGFLFSFAGIGTGAGAIGQIRRTGEPGYGLAVAGIVISVLTLLAGLFLFRYALR